MTDFTPKLEILPPPQRRLWDELEATPNAFTLYGGTAIALHLGHRQSVDFDFFALAPFDPDNLINQIPYLKNAEIVQKTAETLTVRVNRDGPVQVSFFSTPRLGQVKPSKITNDIGLAVASLIDLAALKTVVVQVRAELKDFLDVDAILSSGIDLAEALGAAKIIQGPSFNPQVSLKALCYFSDGDLEELAQPARRRIQDAVKNVDPGRLPEIQHIRRFDAEE